MMDIAEIRKKAKAQASAEKQEPQVSSPAPADQQADAALPEGPETPVIVDETPAEASVDMSEKSPAVVTETAVVTIEESTSKLDQLFSANDDLMLATDASYDQLLQSQTSTRDSSRLQYLAFHLGDEEYALDIRQISEIIKVRDFTDIPRSPDYILGIISLRGVVVPVFDLRRRLNLGSSEMLATSRIVVCQFDELTVGLLVDMINQVANLSDDDIEPPPGVLSGLDRELVSGIGRYQGRMIILLNIENVLSVALD